jgi:L-iditol 2-dehydrogenase
MKAALLYGPKEFRVGEIKTPQPADGEVLMRVESAGVCGSDMILYRQGRIGDSIITEPHVLGHEFSGTIVELGANVTGREVGMRVAVEPSFPCRVCEFCRAGRYNICPHLTFMGLPPTHGAYAEYATVPYDFAHPVPVTLSPDAAATVEPLAVGVHAVELAEMRPGATAAVLGLGPIGLLTAAVAKISGAGTMYGTDLLSYRLELSQRYGVDVPINAGDGDPVEALREATNGRGVDVVFEAAGAVQTPNQAVSMVKPGGIVVMVGISGQEEIPLCFTPARRKELVVKWCRRFVRNFPRAIELASNGSIALDALVTHRFPLEKTGDAFELVANYADGVVKAAIEP